MKLHKPVVFIANVFKSFHGILYGDIALRNKLATEITVICSITVIESSIHLHKVHCTNISGLCTSISLNFSIVTVMGTH